MKSPREYPKDILNYWGSFLPHMEENRIKKNNKKRQRVRVKKKSRK
jgi:hypothetical protein